MNTQRYITLIFLVSMILCKHAAAITIYVDQTSGDDANNGQTPSSAVATITQGLLLANIGDTVNISQGTYSPSNGEALPMNFSGPITLQGAGPELTILDGEFEGLVLNVSGLGAVVSIDGLSVINGESSIGAGMRVNGVAEFSLSNCSFRNNDGNIGAGLYIFNTAEISMTNCEFNNNNGGIGGAMQIEYNNDDDGIMNVTQSTFSSNSASAGSSIHFQGNGDGMHTLNIAQSQFFSNGGGNNVRFQTNVGTSFGSVTNSLFADNPGTALDTQNANVDVVNVTFVNNQTALDGDEQPDVINSIFWDNNIGLGSPLIGVAGDVSFSIVQDLEFGNYIDAGNNLGSNPLLTADYRISSNSPAVDMGSDLAVDNLGLIQDIELEQRKVNLLQLNRPEGFVDIGANEVQDLIFKNGFDE